MNQRRDFIRLIGGGVVLAATSSCAATPDDTRAAWRNPGAAETDPRCRALSWAILAPNPHNMQPWLVDLSAPGELTLYVDTARLLPITDPFNRQIVIGCGAFLELLRMAAAREGLNAAVEPFPAGEPRLLDERPVARVRFSPGGSPDPLFRHVLARRTNRTAFDERPIAASASRTIVDAAMASLVRAGSATDVARVERLKALVFKGAEVEAHTPAAHQESVDRTFIGSKDVAAHRYGISIEGGVIETAHAVGLLTQDRMKRPGSFAFGQSLSFLKTASDTSRGFVWLVTEGDTRAEQLAAGASYVQANLAATGTGLAMHPWSQLLQEYETQDALREAVHRELTPGGGRIQMLARIGYTKPVPPAPRRGLAAQMWRA